MKVIKKQSEIVKYLESIAPPLSTINSIVTKNSLLTTMAANITKLDIKRMKEEFNFTEQFIENEEGFRTKALLRFSEKKSPTLIFIAGTGLSIDMMAFKDYVIPLLNRDYNFILLESSSSGEWIRHNHEKLRLISSGYEAGWDLYLNLKSLHNNSEFIKKTSSTNLIGLSLGGNDACFASYFDQTQETEYIDGSILAICSPYDRFQSLSNFWNIKGAYGIFVKILFREVFKKGQKPFKTIQIKTIGGQ